MSRIAHVFGFILGDVHVYSEEHVLETLGGIVHETELETLLVEEAFGESSSKRIWREGGFVGELQLGKQLLQRKERV